MTSLEVMNLDDKLNKQFSNFSLVIPNPQQDHPWSLKHLHSDFIELRTLFWDKKSFLTLQDAISCYKDDDIEVGMKLEKKIEDEMSSSNTEINDKWIERFESIFSVLKIRDDVFEDDYPFTYNIENCALKLKNVLSDNQKLYLYLLIVSNLNNFKIVQNVLTSEFETFSKEALQQYLPEFIVEEFGKNTQYSGNTVEKIKKLSAKLNVTIDEECIQKNIVENASQDKGLDIIGWRPFKDEIASMVIILGQCACGKDWAEKKNDTLHYEDSYFYFRKIRPIHATFIPYGLVHDTEEFYQNDKTNSKLIFERKRIIDMVKHRIEIFKNSDSYAVVERCISETAIEV